MAPFSLATLPVTTMKMGMILCYSWQNHLPAEIGTYLNQSEQRFLGAEISDICISMVMITNFGGDCTFIRFFPKFSCWSVYGDGST